MRHLNGVSPVTWSDEVGGMNPVIVHGGGPQMVSCLSGLARKVSLSRVAGD
ncbi:MAG: hypothetical protein CM1200mP41_34320 [Gammaproteobacteria bacterium]|nr:MAG: hypothetical protein CM1200mP41_34320 [Gammaproteobacteria bacterium]